MRQIKILTDSCSDMPKSYRDQYNVDYIQYTLYYNSKEITADLDFQTISVKEFYDSLRHGNRIYPLTPTENEIRTKFIKYLKSDCDVLFISSSAKQGESITKAKKIIEELKPDYPDAHIEAIDSLNASIGITLLVLKACMMRDEGKPFEEIVDSVNHLKKNVIQYITLENMKYSSKANKINARAAMIGDMMNVKPIIISDREGNQTAITKVKGRENALKEIVKRFLENVVCPEKQDIFVIHGDDPETAEKIQDMLLKSGVPFNKINLVCLGPVTGVYTGPGTIGIFGIGKEVTFLGE